MSDTYLNMNFKDLTVALGQVDLGVLNNIKPEDFIDFGVANSHIYRQKLFRLMKGLSNKERAYVFVLAAAVKSRERILNELNSNIKFKNEDWAAGVRTFFDRYCVQYVSEQTADSFPVVNIPGSLPSFVALIWKKFTEPAQRTIDNFLSNTWAAQMALTQDLMAEQKAKEIQFWTNTVQSSKSRNFKAGFHEKFWETKAADNYLFLCDNGSVFSPRALSKENLDDWLQESGMNLLAIEANRGRHDPGVMDEQDVTNYAQACDSMMRYLEEAEELITELGSLDVEMQASQEPRKSEFKKLIDSKKKNCKSIKDNFRKHLLEVQDLKIRFPDIFDRVKAKHSSLRDFVDDTEIVAYFPDRVPSARTSQTPAPPRR